jgi:predicted permease
VTILAVAFTAAVVAFGLAHAILWRPLPYAEADRLVMLWERVQTEGQFSDMRVTGAKAVSWKNAAASLEGVSTFGSAGFRVEARDGTRPVWGLRVSGDFFDVLGVQPALGRLLQPADQAAGAPAVVVLSHAYWRTHLGGRTDAVGKDLRLSGTPYRIVGVLPDIWLPAWPVNPAEVRLDPAYRQVFVPMPPDGTLAQNARSHVYGAIGRMRQGASVESVNRELAAMAGPAEPEAHAGSAMPIRSALVHQSRSALLMVFAAAGCVWLLACVNLAALEVAGFEGRLTEFRTRTALGAGLSSLVRQVVVEASPPVWIAAAVAAVTAHGLFKVVFAAFTTRIPFLTAPAFDLSAAAVLGTMALLTWLLLSAWPIVRLSAASRETASSRVTARGLTTFRTLVGAQVAGAVGLLVITGVLLDAFVRIDARDRGFDERSVQVLDVSLWGERYADPHALVDVERRLEERLQQTAWIAGVAQVYDHPYEANWTDGLMVHGDVAGATEDTRRVAELRIVSPTYVRTLRLRLTDGRDFNPGLGLGDRGEVLVNESFVRSADAGIGRLVSLSAPRRSFEEAPATFEIVGVVADEKFRGVEEPSAPAVYVSTRQFPQQGFSLLVRTQEGQDARAADLRALVRDVEAQASVGAPRRLEALGAELQTERHLTTFVIAGFGVGALALAATGVFGLLAVLVANRRREIGVHLALGATPGIVLRQTATSGIAPTAVGIILGGALGLLGERGVRSLLVGVDSTTWPVLVAVAVLMALTATLAGLIPARRAASVDPASVLRQ